MTRVPTHDIDSAPEGSRDGLKALHEKFGTTLNIFGAMAHAPTVLNTFLAIEGAITDHSSLDARTREAIHLTVAAVNECDYCQGAYTMAAKAAGFDDEQAKQIRRGHLDGDDLLTALLTFAREVAAHRGTVQDTTWTAATDAGWSEEELLEAFADTVRTVFTNYFNHLVDTDQDVPAAPAL
jgi:uncharacterized peroxidase-related enzyme